MIEMRKAWGQTLVDLGGENDKLVVLDADLANSTKADMFAEKYPDRFFQMGIAEQNMVGVAAGLADGGYIPWLSSFAIFFTHRAVDQIRMLVAQCQANVKIAGCYSGLLIGAVGKTHLDVQDIAIMRAMPGMVVLAPGDAPECSAAMRWATQYDGPVYLRLSRDASPSVGSSRDQFVVGRPECLRNGRDIALISTGPQTARVLEAAQELELHGLSARVIHVASLKPLGTEMLIAGVEGTNAIITVEEHSVLGGLGSIVAEALAESGAGICLTRIGINDEWGESAPNDYLLRRHGLDSESIVQQVLSGLSSR
jgi:transketolase